MERKKKILIVSGSARRDGSCAQLITLIGAMFTDLIFYHFTDLHDLPLFRDQGEICSQVSKWQKLVKDHDALIIVTPEYIQGVPSAIKSALEWVTQSGELYHKKVLPIIFTHQAPRGEKTEKSLLWTLQALGAIIPTSLLLHHDVFDAHNNINNETTEMLKLVMDML